MDHYMLNAYHRAWTMILREFFLNEWKTITDMYDLISWPILPWSAFLLFLHILILRPIVLHVFLALLIRSFLRVRRIIITPLWCWGQCLTCKIYSADGVEMYPEIIRSICSSSSSFSSSLLSASYMLYGPGYTNRSSAVSLPWWRLCISF